MKKLLTIIAAMIMCNAYGTEENIVYLNDNGSVYSNQTCNSGGNITPPTTPTKSGYRFIGWREATIDEVLPLPVQSYTPAGESSSTTWTARFQYGTVTGTSRCSSTTGSCNNTYSNCTTTSNPSANSGSNCWCKLTDAGPLSNFIDVSSLTWVYGPASPCDSQCARACGYYLRGYIGFRRAVFGVGGA